MDRTITYFGQVPLETDLLNTNRNTMVALGKLIGAVFGTGGMVNGLVVAPTSPASLSVNIGQGEIYSLQNVDDTPYSSLPADTTDTIVKQGIQLATVVKGCAAPTTSGFSINYLIQATYLDSDTGTVVLPYYNASNPQQPYAGPDNNGVAQATLRQGLVSVIAKPGIAATTGTQTTPAPDAGYIALAVVTVANGQTTIIAGNIVASIASQVLSQPLSAGRLLNTQTFSTAGTFTYTPSPGTRYVIVEVQGAGGGGGGAPATTSAQVSASSGGGGGSFAKSRITSAFAGVTVTVGAAGVGGASGANNGSPGGTSSFGSLVSAPGGNGGLALAATAPPTSRGGVAASSPPVGANIESSIGQPGNGTSIISLTVGNNGFGGSSVKGPAGAGAGGSPGVGGAGISQFASQAAIAGFNGGNGLVVVWEYA